MMRLFIFLLFVAPTLLASSIQVGSGGSGSVNVGRGGSGTVKWGTAVNGAGGGTYYLGDNVGSDNLSAQETNADESYWSSTVFTTTAAGTVGLGCVKGGGIPGAVNLKLHIISNASPHAVICTSDAISMLEGSTSYQCDEMSDDGCGTLAATTSYGIAVTVAGSMNIYWTNAGQGDWDTGLDTVGSYATPPTTFTNFTTTNGDLNFTHPLAAYVEVDF